MIELELDRDRRAAPTLVDQIVQGFARAIDAQSLRAGALLPSVLGDWAGITWFS